MGHRIDELPSITTPSDSDKVVVEHDNLTSQITLARLIAAERARLNQLESALQDLDDEIASINNGFANSLNSSDLISFTPLVGASYGNYGNCYYFKKGNQVHVHIGMSGLTANARNTVFMLPSGYRPISMVCATGKGGTSYIAYSIITVYTNGEIIVSGTDEYAGVDVMFLAAS